jgi:hypothetical protein
MVVRGNVEILEDLTGKNLTRLRRFDLIERVIRRFQGNPATLPSILQSLLSLPLKTTNCINCKINQKFDSKFINHARQKHRNNFLVNYPKGSLSFVMIYVRLCRLYHSRLQLLGWPTLPTLALQTNTKINSNFLIKFDYNQKQTNSHEIRDFAAVT